MKEGFNNNKFSQIFQLMSLITFTTLSVVTIVEDIILSWEKWPLVLIVTAVVVAWSIHVQMRLSSTLRIWICTILMMGTFFFYGIHSQSIFDASIIGVGILIICALTGITKLVTFCQVTYYITILYNLFRNIYLNGTKDTHYYLRIILHVLVVTVIAHIGRVVIDKWTAEIEEAQIEIDKLNDSTERLDDFLAGTSHELRTPVGAIMGISESCMERTEDDKLRSDLMIIKNAGNRIASQISDILDYSELDRNRLAVTPENYMISSLLGDLVTALKPYLTPDVELVLDIDPSIPSVMCSDGNKIKKIMWHLIINALKYTEKGGVYVHVTADDQEYGVNLCIDIVDTGIGMTEDELNHAKERFYQADGGMTKSKGGLGLGLPIVDGFVKALGGFMLIDSAPDEGTKVHICIPQKVVDGASCMSVNDPEKVSLGAYFRFGKYSVPEVGKFYGSLITNVVKGMGVMVHGVDSIDELKRVVDNTYISHLFVGMKEYESDPDYIESLTSKMLVFITADKGYKLPAGSKIRFFEKPLYCFPIISAINSGHAYEENNDQMICEGVKILVVDDEPLNIKVATKLFSKYKMDITTAASGYKAIELCAEQDFDIVFMDYMMPGIDGVETVKRIRSNAGNFGKMPLIVAMTANVVSTARDMFKREGFDGFVGKPVNKNELERVLKNILNPSRITYVKKDAFSEGGFEEPASQSTDNMEQPEDAMQSESETLVEAAAENAIENVTEDTMQSESETLVEAAAENATENVAEDAMQSESETLVEAAAENVTENVTEDTMQADSFDGMLRQYGIDIQVGIEYCQGDEEMYREILDDFAGEAEASVKELEGYYSDNDTEAYRVKIHSLKGLLRMIGAGTMADKALELEQAAKDGRLGEMKEKHDEVLAWYSDFSGRLL